MANDTFDLESLLDIFAGKQDLLTRIRGGVSDADLARPEAAGQRLAIQRTTKELDAISGQIRSFSAGVASTVTAAAPAPRLQAALLFPEQPDTPVATGFDLFERTIDLLLRTEQEKRATLDQAVQTAGLLTELERVSPTRAAGIATRLGLPDRINFDFTRAFGAGAGPLTSGGTGPITGQIGGQQIRLPGQFSGQELAFLDANPGVGNVLSDIADFLGAPDLIARSRANVIPTSRQLTAIAA